MEDDIARIKQALSQQQSEIFRNAADQLDAIADLLRAHRFYMARSGRAVLGEQYRNPSPAFDQYGQPNRRN